MKLHYFDSLSTKPSKPIQISAQSYLSVLWWKNVKNTTAKSKSVQNCVQICLLIPLNMCALLLCTKFFMLLKFCLWTVECSITGLSPLMHFRYAVENADADDSIHLKTAAFKGHVGVVRELLKHGAKVESADEDGCTHIHTAASNGHVEVDRELLKLLLIIIILFLILLLFRLKPVFPDFMARGLCWEFSSVSTVCLDCALPVNEYL